MNQETPTGVVQYDLLVEVKFMSDKCPYGNFVIHYKNGDTKMEDRTDPNSWDRLFALRKEKEGIHTLGFQYFPFAIPFKNKAGEQIRVKMPEHILFGSSTYKQAFFQMKTKEKFFAMGKDPKKPKAKSGERFLNLTIGKVIDKNGTCVCMEFQANGHVKTFTTSSHSIKLNLEMFQIDLNEIGEIYEKPIDQPA